MKVHDIQTIYSSLSTLKTKRFPIRMALVLTRNFKKMDDAMKDIEEKKHEILDPYLEKTFDDGRIKFKPDAPTKEITNQLNELFNTELDICLDHIEEEDLKKCEDNGFDVPSIEEMASILSMIKEPSE